MADHRKAAGSCFEPTSSRIFGVANAIVTARHPYRFVFARVFRATGICRWMKIRRDGYQLKFFPSAFSASLWTDVSETPDDERFLRTFLRPGQVVVDVGANIGTHSIVSAMRVGTTGRVYAFEAHPTTVRFLRQNIRLNQLDSIIKVIDCALGEASGEAVFSDKRSDDQNCILPGSAPGISVRVRPLDSLLSEERIDLLKIDVEGFELMVLRGARRTLSRTGAIYFEAWDQHFARYGYSFGDLWEFLHSQGFKVVNPTTEKYIARSERIAECVNLLALKDTCNVTN
jgi:FkbM family methyltransferase